jgi:penicillin amidase
MIATGQSGNPLSPFYGNLAEPWRDGKYLRFDGRQNEASESLTLQPE